jgi:hypothetical protein
VFSFATKDLFNFILLLITEIARAKKIKISFGAVKSRPREKKN